MFRIGEFSKLTQVTSRMLRYYDEMGLLKPEYIDSVTGYRMYSVSQIPLLNKIIYLRDSGFNVTEIREALERNDDALIIRQLDEKSAEIEMSIKEAQEKLRKIKLARQEILYSKSEMHYNISIKSVPGYQVLSYRKIIPNYYAEGELYKEMAEFAEKHQIRLTGEAFSLYHDIGYKERDVDVELCAHVKNAGESFGGFIFRNTEAVPAMASTMVYGEFTNIAGVYLAFDEWLKKNSQYKMTTPSRQIVHRGPWNEEDPDKYLVEIQIPLEHPGRY